MTDPFRFGFIALLGRPNVGKSTLVNALVGQKVSITSRRPQTTRHRILGVRTRPDSQMVFVDTPGLHRSGKRAINVAMNRAARSSLEDVDLVLLVITARGWNEADEAALALAEQQSSPVILAINKIDQLKDKSALLPLIEASDKKMRFAEIVPVSARSGRNMGELEEAIRRHLPEGPPGFPDDQVSDRGDRFMSAELVREQLFNALGQELPYATAVEIERFNRERSGMLHIDAVIWVEKAGQKAIVIGKSGERLKRIGKQARVEMERMFKCKVYLGLWVKVREEWTDNAALLRTLGYWEDG